MYRAIFGIVKKGKRLDVAELKALYALIEPTLLKLKMKRLKAKDLDERLIEAFPFFYEYFALHSEKPDSYWENLNGSFPEKKADREYRKAFRETWKALYPSAKKLTPEEKAAKAAAKAAAKK